LVFRAAVFARQPSNSPASYFRDTNMPAPVIADCLNYNLRFTRGVEDVGILLTEDGHVNELRAVNLTHRAALQEPVYREYTERSYFRHRQKIRRTSSGLPNPTPVPQPGRPSCPRMSRCQSATPRIIGSSMILDLAGTAIARSVLEAMITHSDDAATDIATMKVGADRLGAL
jgi:hypothetical protein